MTADPPPPLLVMGMTPVFWSGETREFLVDQFLVFLGNSHAHDPFLTSVTSFMISPLTLTFVMPCLLTSVVTISTVFVSPVSMVMVVVRRRFPVMRGRVGRLSNAGLFVVWMACPRPWHVMRVVHPRRAPDQWVFPGGGAIDTGRWADSSAASRHEREMQASRAFGQVQVLELYGLAATRSCASAICKTKRIFL